MVKTMIIITDYTLAGKPDSDVFMIKPQGLTPPCPCCGGPLYYRDSRERIMKHEGGEKTTLIIRRLRCSKCHRLHNELPDCLTPYKHYAAETISGVLDGIVTPDDDDAEDYPCAQTMRRWILWLIQNIENIEGSLRRAGHTILGLGEGILSSSGSLLKTIRARYQNWLEIILRVIYNSGGSLASAG